MARNIPRYLALIALAVAIEPLRVELLSTFDAGRPATAHAQGVPGSNPADPYSSGGFDYNSRGVGSYSSPGATNPYLPTPNGPMSPTPPTNPSRPAGWPGGPQDPAAVAAPAAAPQTPPPSPIRKSPADPPYDPADILATVGGESIQGNEVIPEMNRLVNAAIAPRAADFAKIPQEQQEEILKEYRRQAMRHAVEDLVKIKLLLADCKRKIPPEGQAKFEEKIRKEFNSKHVKPLMDQFKASSYIDLENKLRAQGSSIDAQRALFIERYLALGWLSEKMKDKENQEATHEQMLTFYREHISDWETPSRVRWEQLSVKFLNFDSKQAAWTELARWGNEIWNGAPFAEVAKAHSQDVAAEDGGVHDWTSKGSLRSTVLDEALFTLPEGKLSAIIEDDEGFHIIRVLNREEAKRTPFSEVQPDIKKQMHDGNLDRERLNYIAKLREHTPVTTVFDDIPRPVARQQAGTATR